MPIKVFKVDFRSVDVILKCRWCGHVVGPLSVNPCMKAAKERMKAHLATHTVRD